MIRLVVFIVVLVLAVGCKIQQPTVFIETKDSSIEKTITKIDTQWVVLPEQRLNINGVVTCDSLNRAQMKIIDSLNNKLGVKVWIKDGKLYIEAKKASERYYYLYIYERTLKEFYQKSVKKEVKEVKEPINKKLFSFCLFFLSTSIIFLTLYIKKLL